MKTKIGLLISSILIVILATSSLWLYTETNTLQKQVSILQTDKDDLQIKINNLQSQIDSLNATYQTYMETHSYSNSEYNTLQSELSNLTVQLSDLQNQMDLLNATYQNYMETHSYSNSEYNTLQSEIDWLLNELGEANFFFYYVKQPEQKFGVYDLRDELNSLEWSQPYQRGIFDCSEMSANLEWYLENRGWHTFIVVGDTPFDSGRHAWLLVETSEGKYMPVESVTIGVVWWENSNFDNYFIYDNIFETIQETVDYNESGFDWWKSAGLGSKIAIG